VTRISFATAFPTTRRYFQLGSRRLCAVFENVRQWWQRSCTHSGTDCNTHNAHLDTNGFTDSSTHSGTDCRSYSAHSCTNTSAHSCTNTSAHSGTNTSAYGNKCY
jgi:hypothetical protein